MTVDRWGMDIGGSPESIAAWNEAWDRFLHFTGDPLELLTEANENDDDFVMGSVLAAIYAVTAGAPLDAPTIVDSVARIEGRSTPGLEKRHLPPLRDLVAGNFTSAADQWALLGAYEGDFVAYRFAHDVFLHVGDATRRLDWSEKTLGHGTMPAGHTFIEGMHSFALNEVGRFDEARDFGERSLAADPLDVWARHALAHVYEDTDDHVGPFALMEATIALWEGQDALALHLWWHLALRYLAVGRRDEALALYDTQRENATTPFRMCDMTSLLWRLDLLGHDTGDRWDVLADRWAGVAERHTCGFLDLHAALTFIRRPDHHGADVWFSGLAARPNRGAEIDDIFESVTKPLVAALRAADPDALDKLTPSLHRIGGSNAQRRIISLTAGAWR